MSLTHQSHPILSETDRVALRVRPLTLQEQISNCSECISYVPNEPQIGIVGSLPVLPETMHSELLLDVPMVTVVAPSHPLASYKGIIPQAELQKHVQLVLTDRSTLSKGQSYGVFSKNVWRLADMGARHAFLRAGFGFGNMPHFMVEDDIASKKLRIIRIELPRHLKPLMPMRAVYRNDAPPGPGTKQLADKLGQLGVDLPLRNSLHGRIPYG